MFAVRCLDCGSNWTAGEFKEDCDQCGGGAMERACFICGGRCGGVFKRAVMDSQDEGEAHWIGGCLLPKEEQRALIEAEVERMKRESQQEE